MKFKLLVKICLVISIVLCMFFNLSLNVEAKDIEEGLKTKTLKVTQENQKMIIEMKQLIKQNNDLLAKISAQLSVCNAN